MSEPSDASPGFYGRLAAAVMDRPRAAILILVLVSAIAALLTTRIRLDPDMLNLLPPDEPATRALRDLQHDAGAVNLMTITVEGPEGVDVIERALRGLLGIDPKPARSLVSGD